MSLPGSIGSVGEGPKSQPGLIATSSEMMSYRTC